MKNILKFLPSIAFVIFASGCMHLGYKDFHERLSGAWITEDGKTQYVFKQGKLQMIESGKVYEFSYIIEQEKEDYACLRITLIKTGSGYQQHLHFKDNDQIVDIESELNGIKIPGKWYRVTPDTFKTKIETSTDRDSGISESHQFYLAPNGKKISHGKQIIKYHDGKLKGEINFQYGELHGRSCAYSPKGVLLFEMFCNKGMMDGVTKSFKEDGSLLTEGMWVKGRMKSGTFIVGPAIYEMDNFKLKRLLNREGKLFTGEINQKNFLGDFRIKISEGHPLYALDSEGDKYSVTNEGLVGELIEEEKSDFEKWLTDPVARKKITGKMFAEQDDWRKIHDKRERIEAAVMKMDEETFMKFLPDLKSEDEVCAALKKLVMIGKTAHWDKFKSLNSSNKDAINRLWNIKEGLQEKKKKSSMKGDFYVKLYGLALEELKEEDWPKDSLLDIIIMSDPISAKKEFNKAEWYKKPNRKAAEILLGINRNGIKLDKKMLSNLFDKYKDAITEWEAGDFISELIYCMDLSGVANSDKIAYNFLLHEKVDNYASSKIAEVICKKYGYTDIDSYMREKYKKEIKRTFPYEKGDKLYKAWVSIGSLDAEVRNGGFLQYFGNGYGYQFLDAVETAKGLGDPELYQLLVSVKNEFDKYPPQNDYSDEKLGKIYDKIKKQLNEFDDKYIKIGEKSDARLKLFLVSKMKNIDLISKIPKK